MSDGENYVLTLLRKKNQLLREELAAVKTEQLALERVVQAAEDLTATANARISILETAIHTFLTAQGHDLCHVNRHALWQALRPGSAEPPDPMKVTRAEFERGCADYADLLYNVEKKR